MSGGGVSKRDIGTCSGKCRLVREPLRETDVNGVRTHVETVGDGPPVLFLHGAATIEGFGFVEGLADRFQVLLPNHPGFGRSGDTPHVAGMADLVVHYLDLVDALKLGRKPHLMGFPMGGWMAAELAAVAREKFDRIVFVAPAGIAHPDHPPADLSATAPQDFPSYLVHDASVALCYFPYPAGERSSQTFAAARERGGRQNRRATGLRTPQPVALVAAHHQSGTGSLGRA